MALAHLLSGAIAGTDIFGMFSLLGHWDLTPKSDISGRRDIELDPVTGLTPPEELRPARAALPRRVMPPFEQLR